jgi:hypothetical protein
MKRPIPLLLLIFTLLPLLLSAKEVVLEPQEGEPVATFNISYYGEIGCSHCDTYLSRTLPAIADARGVRFVVEARDIMDPEGYEVCRRRLEERGRRFRTFPVLFVGNNAYQGKGAVRDGLEAEIAYRLQYRVPRPEVPPTMDGSVATAGPDPSVVEKLALLPIFLAGAADGINPCAFATLLFLLSLLSLLGKSSRELLLIGLLFTATVFLTYLALGFGILNLLRAATSFEILRLLFRVIFSLGALVFGVLAIRDAVHIREGRSSQVVLKLSAQNRRRIHAVLRERFRRSGLLVGTVVAAFLVSLMELACTGQLYLPTLAYLLQTGSTLPAEVGALLLYNVAFVTPLLLLFLLVYFGVSSKRISRWFEARAAATRAVSAVAFLVLAASIWLV